MLQILTNCSTHWTVPGLGTLEDVIETVMRVRVHRPFTHQTYMATLYYYEVFHNDPLRRQQNSTLALMYVWSVIDNAKRNGNNIAVRNHNRNYFQ